MLHDFFFEKMQYLKRFNCFKLRKNFFLIIVTQKLFEKSERKKVATFESGQNVSCRFTQYYWIPLYVKLFKLIYLNQLKMSQLVVTEILVCTDEQERLEILEKW